MAFLQLPFVQAFLKMLLNYVNFTDRTSRADFWWAYLAICIVSAVVGFICGILGGIGEIFMILINFALTIPSIALGARRLHDTGKSALWLLLALTGVGVIALIVFWAQPGDDGDNQYGSDPTSGYGY